ncbi:hypothetical protein [Roseicyclus elongatus]|nr:hypothetical protein [Roseibacterium elongatum]
MLRMILRPLINKLVNKGVDVGIDQIARRRNGGQAAEELPDDQRARVRDTQRNARQMMRTARRFTRF